MKKKLTIVCSNPLNYFSGFENLHMMHIQRIISLFYSVNQILFFPTIYLLKKE